ncbi:hypothetical protein CNMCM8980_001153 [Aspergillus fumigatiaffinis]|nr:hypothetical protein CNMCM8980_001153 [Aspergillus fumigatiaffinis]
MKTESQLDEQRLSSANNTMQQPADGAPAASPSHPELIVPGMVQRRLRSQLDDENLQRSTHINRAGTRDAAIAVELCTGDEDGGTTTVAVELGHSRQDTERYPAVPPDPEQARRVAIERQKAEDLLFDTPSEDTEDQRIGEVQEKPISEGFASDLHQDGELPSQSMSIADHSAQDQTHRKNVRLHGRALRKVAGDDCVRAAISDGNFTIFMRFGRDLIVTRQSVQWEVPREL